MLAERNIHLMNEALTYLMRWVSELYTQSHQRIHPRIMVQSTVMSCAAGMNCNTQASPPNKLILDRTLIGVQCQISTRNLGILSCHLRTISISEGIKFKKYGRACPKPPPPPPQKARYHMHSLCSPSFFS